MGDVQEDAKIYISIDNAANRERSLYMSIYTSLYLSLYTTSPN